MTTDQPLTPIATRYTVCALPIDHKNARYVKVFIDRRPGDQWVVTDGAIPAQFADAAGKWAYRDSDATDYDTWQDLFHHDFETATRLAQDAAQAALREMGERYGIQPDQPALGD